MKIIYESRTFVQYLNLRKKLQTKCVRRPNKINCETPIAHRGKEYENDCNDNTPTENLNKLSKRIIKHYAVKSQTVSCIKMEWISCVS